MRRTWLIAFIFCVTLRAVNANTAYYPATMNPLASAQSSPPTKPSIDKIKMLAKQVQLWYFFESGCQYCIRFSPILKQFATQYGFTIIPISLDGKPSSEFPKTARIPSQLQNLSIPVVPALYIANPQTQNFSPLSYGLASESQLLQRVLYYAPN